MTKINIKSYFVISVLILSALSMVENNAFAATAPSLGTASNFAVLAGSAVTCTGGGIAGNVGVYPGTAITLTGCPVNGSLHSGDLVAAQAQIDALAAYNNLLGQACTGSLTSTPVTQTLTPGVYCSPAGVTMTSIILTLNGSGVYIFKIGAALTMTSSQILLVNGAQASNVFWQVTSAATLTTTTFEGTLIAKDGAITATGTTANCGLLALNFAVTSTDSTITECMSDPLPNPPPPVDLPLTTQGRMTGGGSVIDPTGTPSTRVTHGFTLQCDVTNGPNNLEVNWGKGNKFHLDSLTSAICADDAAIAPKPPAAGFDTYVGTGTGSLNGVSGATAIWIFTDAGEPGKNDHATIVITDGSNIVLSVSGNLQKGNQQAHK